MDTKAKDLFERNPKVDTLYKVKAQSIYFTSKEGADNHVEGDTDKLDTLSRADFFPKENDADGLPDKNWKNDQIMSFLDDEGVLYNSDDTKNILLRRSETHVEKGESLPTSASSREDLEAFLTAYKIEFTEVEDEKALYVKVRNILNQ